MKLAAVGIFSSDITNSVRFYEILGFKFPEFKPDEDHLEPITAPGEMRLMIDSKKLLTELLGKEPSPANHSAFALEYSSAAEVDEIAAKVKAAGFKVQKEPWDAFWGQRYAIVADPDGQLVDLFANLA